MINKEKFVKYADLLQEWAPRVNLVAPSTLTDINMRHVMDSAQLADVLPQDVQLIDLGSGAGFPGVVLAVMGWSVTCVESIGKKANFLNLLKQELDLPNLAIYHGRVEDFIKSQKLNKSELIITARAFAPLYKILDYVHPVKSRLFLLKGRDVAVEIAVAQQRYKFDYRLMPSKTGDGFIVQIENIKLFHAK